MNCNRAPIVKPIIMARIVITIIVGRIAKPIIIIVEALLNSHLKIRFMLLPKRLDRFRKRNNKNRKSIESCRIPELPIKSIEP